MRPVVVLVCLILFPLPAAPVYGLMYLWMLAHMSPEEAAAAATVPTVFVSVVGVCGFAMLANRFGGSRRRIRREAGASDPADPERRRRRERARAGGDVVMALAILDDDRKKR